MNNLSPEEVQPARPKGPQGPCRCWLPDKNPQKKCNLPGQKGRKARAGAGCRTRTPRRSATCPAKRAARPVPVLVAGQEPPEEVQPASLRRLEPTGDTTQGCAGCRTQKKSKSNAGEQAPPRPPFTGFEEGLHRVKGTTFPCGVWGSAPKRSATCPAKKLSLSPPA